MEKFDQACCATNSASQLVIASFPLVSYGVDRGLTGLGAPKRHALRLELYGFRNGRFNPQRAAE